MKPNQDPSKSVSKSRRAFAAGVAAGGLLVGGAVAAESALNHTGKAHTRTNEVRDYVTQPGDTEWSIAHRAYPNSDPREKISVIDNAADKAAGADIQPGNVPPYLQLELPADAAIGTLTTPHPVTTETVTPEQRGGTVRPTPTQTH